MFNVLNMIPVRLIKKSFTIFNISSRTFFYGNLLFLMGYFFVVCEVRYIKIRNGYTLLWYRPIIWYTVYCILYTVYTIWSFTIKWPALALGYYLTKCYQIKILDILRVGSLYQIRCKYESTTFKTNPVLFRNGSCMYIIPSY